MFGKPFRALDRPELTRYPRGSRAAFQIPTQDFEDV